MKPLALYKIVFLSLFTLFLTIACERNRSELAPIPSPPDINGELVFCGMANNSDRYDIYYYNLDSHRLNNITEVYTQRNDDGYGHDLQNGFGYSIGCDPAGMSYRATGVAWSPSGELLIVNAGGPYLRTPFILRITENGEAQGIVEQWPESWDTRINIFVEPTMYAWSPQGDKIAFIGQNGYDGYLNLFIGDVSDWENSDFNTSVIQATEIYRDFPGIMAAPSWSPDGSLLAISLVGPVSGVALVSANGSWSRLVSNETSDLLSPVDNPSPWVDYPTTTPSWAPDGESLVFVAATSQASDRTALFRVDADGTNLELLVPEGVRNPVVSPDGQYIAYIEYASLFDIGIVGRIICIDIDGQNRKIIAELPSAAVTQVLAHNDIRDLSWSPDGNSFVFTSNRSGNFQLYLASANGGEYVQVLDFLGDAVFPRWRPINYP